MIVDMVEPDDGTRAVDGRDGPVRFYERYIEAFNARDEPTFASCFHLPVSILRLPADGVDQTGATPIVVTEVAQLWPALPPTWTRSTIDELRVVAADEAYEPRAGFADRSPRRAVLQATVTRWAGDEPYEQVHVLYILSNEDGRLGIKSIVPLAVASAPAG